MPGALIRIGRKGRTVDNFHHFGVGAQVDVETGYVFTKGIDKTGMQYVLHPDSNKAILGFKVPFWDEIRATVLKAAMVRPDVRYVGWDVTINKEGKIILIEGNDRADPDLAQMSDKTGKWQAYKELMEQII